MSGSGSPDELKRSHPPGQVTPLGRTKEARTGGETRFGGSGHTFSSALFSSSPFSDRSSSANLMRFVLISEVGSSAGERRNKINE